MASRIAADNVRSGWMLQNRMRMPARQYCGDLAMSNFSRSGWKQLFATGLVAAMTLPLAGGSAAAQGSNEELEVVAAQIRSQGLVCRNPSTIERVPEESRPNEPVYLVKCEGVSYRVRLVPHRAAEVSQSE